MESGSFSYLRNSVCNTYGIPRNSAEFRLNFTVKIPRNSAKFRGIPCVFQKIPYSAGSKKSTSVDTLVGGYQPMSTAVHRSPNKLWRSNSIFNRCQLRCSRYLLALTLKSQKFISLPWLTCSCHLVTSLSTSLPFLPIEMLLTFPIELFLILIFFSFFTSVIPSTLLSLFTGAFDQIGYRSFFGLVGPVPEPDLIFMT